MYKRYLEPLLRSNPTKYITKKLKLGENQSNTFRNHSFENNGLQDMYEIVNENVEGAQGEGTTIETRSNDEIRNEGIMYGNASDVVETDISDSGDCNMIYDESYTVGQNIEEQEDNEFDNFFNSINDELVHPNLQCQTADAIIMILEFFLHHRLTWVALEQLLKLFGTILGEESRLPKTKYFFQKILGDKNESAVFHIYCKNCQMYINTYENLKLENSLNNQGERNMKCSNCQCSFSLQRMNDGNFFIQLPVRNQICKKIVQNPEILNFDTSPDPNNCIRDIFDGNLYKKLRQKIGDGKLITLTMNTDGVKVFKSKGMASLWPIQMFMNEIPSQTRFKREKIILTGIWFGKSVNVALYLKPFADELDDLDENKIQVTEGDSTYDVTVRGLVMSTDTTARCKFMAMKQFNGLYGCTYCLHPGDPLGDPKNRRYPVGDYPLRSHSSTVALMEELSRTGEGDFGVKGISPLLAIKDYDLIRGTVIDYMHCVLLGVVRLLLSLWLNSENHFEKFYVTPRRANVVNKHLKGITPLKSFSRLPRTTDDRGFWKANECRNWLLYYAIPCLNGTLKDVYLQHFKLLSEAIFILLKTNISPTELNKASRNLIEFVIKFQCLYGIENMVYNIHLLTHLIECVRDCGPLWAFSNFIFESNNGLLVRFVKGTTDVEQQIATKYGYSNVLESLKRIRNNARTYIDRILNNRVKFSKKIGVVTLLGKPQRQKLKAHEKIVLNQDIILDYKKFFFSHDVFCSTNYKRAKKTNDTVICLKDGSFGEITRIYENSGTVYFLIKKFHVHAANYLPIQIRKVSSYPEIFQTIPVHDISEKCILMTIGNEKYISKLPNRVESD